MSYEVTIDVVVTGAVEAVVAAVVLKLSGGAEEKNRYRCSGSSTVGCGDSWSHFGPMSELQTKNLANIMQTFVNAKINFVLSIPVDGAVVDPKLSVAAA